MSSAFLAQVTSLTYPSIHSTHAYYTPTINVGVMMATENAKMNKTRSLPLMDSNPGETNMSINYYNTFGKYYNGVITRIYGNTQEHLRQKNHICNSTISRFIYTV